MKTIIFKQIIFMCIFSAIHFSAVDAMKRSAEDVMENNQTDTKEVHQLFQCKTCGKLLINKHNLQLHQAVHSNERPYKCNICHKTFKRSGNLMEHHRIHKKNRPLKKNSYKCETCNKIFNRKNQLAVHKKTHNPYACIMCNRSFKQEREFIMHKDAPTHKNNLLLQNDLTQTPKEFPSTPENIQFLFDMSDVLAYQEPDDTLLLEWLNS